MKRYKKWIALIIAAVVFIGGGAYWYIQTRQANTVSSSITAATAVNLDNGDEDIDWDSLPTTNITLSDQELTITQAGTYIITGTTDAGIKVTTDGNVRLALSNATIRSTTGPGVYVENADNTIIQLVEGTQNTIEDSATRSDETLDGAIYSADDLIFNGTGSLNVISHFADAIVSNDDLKIDSGTYTISSVDDGIRGKDSVYIVDGSVTVTAAADGIKSTNDSDIEKGYVYIKAGSVTVNAADDGIHAEQKIVIDGGAVTVASSTEGIEAALVTITGGTVKVTAADDGINGSASTLITNPIITITGGTVDVTVGNGDTDAIDSNGDVTITGGAITITAPTSAIDYDGTATFSGGTLVVNGEQLSEIPQEQMGGGAPGSMR